MTQYVAAARLGAAIIGLFCLSAPAWADDAPGLRPLCPDRPGKGTSPCTVDMGHFQLEVDVADGTFQRAGGVTTDTTILVAPNLKYGVSDTFDIEAGITPYLGVRTHAGATDTTQSGFGDLYLRGKWNFYGGDGPLSAVIEPFIKVPTATNNLGNGEVEGGVVLPLGYDLGGGWSLGSTPELDILLDAAGNGRHASFVDVIGIGHSLGPVALGAELWTSQNFDPAGTTSQYSFDLSAAWAPTDNMQLDGGVNLGLNKNTPGAQVYFGVSQRF